jgi:hypothetical protein
MTTDDREDTNLWRPNILMERNSFKMLTKEEDAFKNVNNCWNTNISFCLETSGGQSFNQYLIVVRFFNTSVN